ncbi:MAG: tRNA (adenosine(37)-N6)-threonylcarbamoyltransferase complex dimerization subunit type 1 TsaB [Cyanobacteria bacterium SID2]|nr:tRNA (adenosine(37)-N6)-threonylcarbamoyltransferase complex dimerization subunit type 1 TsaB [Cyanobacteria bacterium SID2]MBP0006386.1 tRNA (adenosine(37)-N6)-threonylcarbamoyltransferase complex dimerization subunit type 1 TsaB [Cyanobacteria bacterium SBC]
MTQSYGLALHTTTSQLGLAINDFRGDARCHTWNLDRSLSTHLHVTLAEFLAPQTWQDLAFLAVAKGPGSFTGTRIGVVTARVLAQQLEIPLFAVSTLAAVARVSQANDDTDLAIQMLAARGQLFTAIYKRSPDGHLATLLPDTVSTVEQWAQTLDRWQAPYTLVKADEATLATSVSSLLELASFDYQHGLRPHWSSAIPFYGQHPVVS